MNQQEFYKLIQGIDIDSSKIPQIARYCLTKVSNHQREITKILENYLRSERWAIDFKLKIIEMMSYILVELKGKKFIRHFSVRIKSFLATNSRQIVRDDQLSEKVIQLFNKWKENKIFADSFIKIIREVASSILGVEEVVKVSPFVKYSKSYLMAYQDVSKVSEAMFIYKTICDKDALMNKISELKKQIEQSTNEEDKKEEDTTILMKQCQSYITQLVKIINNFQKTSKNLSRMIKEEAGCLQITEEELALTNDC